VRSGADGRLSPWPEGAAAPVRPAGPGQHPIPVPGQPDALLVVPPGVGGVGGGRAPLLVFCHGAGGSALGALPLVEAAAADVGALLLLRSSTGRTWDLVLGVPGPDTLTVDAALQQQVAGRCAVDPDRIAVGGFSDGGSYALSLGLANGRLFGAVLAFSPGFVGRRGPRAPRGCLSPTARTTRCCPWTGAGGGWRPTCATAATPSPTRSFPAVTGCRHRSPPTASCGGSDPTPEPRSGHDSTPVRAILATPCMLLGPRG
jgi:poly(3-hydroxybutyrate) depolymerase